MERRLRMTYDAEADAAYIYVVDPIGPGEAVTQRVLDSDTAGGSVIVDFDHQNRLLGFEVLGVSHLLRPEAVPSDGG